MVPGMGGQGQSPGPGKGYAMKPVELPMKKGVTKGRSLARFFLFFCGHVAFLGFEFQGQKRHRPHPLVMAYCQVITVTAQHVDAELVYCFALLLAHRVPSMEVSR